MDRASCRTLTNQARDMGTKGEDSKAKRGAEAGRSRPPLRYSLIAVTAHTAGTPEAPMLMSTPTRNKSVLLAGM